MPLEDMTQMDQAPADDGQEWPNHHMEPVDHDPFDDPESIQAVLKSVAQVEQRIFAMEMVIAQAVNRMQETLENFAASMQGLHDAHGDLQRTIAAPRKILRDQDGRPTGVTIDHEPQMGPMGQ
jgi:hypothetical protein